MIDRHRFLLLPIAAMAAVSLAAPRAQAQTQSAPAAPAQRFVTVVGHGEARARPDQASITVGVETEAPTAQAALADNERRMSGLLAAIKRAGVPDRSVQTVGVSVFPVYGEGEQRRAPRVVGYRVSNEVRFTTTNIDKLGALLDQVVQQGGNQVRGIEFGFRDEGALRERARAEAVADAERRARQLAKATGAELGPVQSIVEGGGGQPRPPTMAMRSMAVAEAAVPIAPGESGVNVDVEITWSLR